MGGDRVIKHLFYTFCSFFFQVSVYHWKRLVFIPIPKKGNAKECSNYCTIALISQASKEMLEILQARFQQYLNPENPEHSIWF